MSLDLSRLFLPPARGAGVQPVMYGLCTAWSATPPYHSTVVVGTVSYTNLAVLNPAAMSVGAVLLLNTGGPPIILGPLRLGT